MKGPLADRRGSQARLSCLGALEPPGHHGGWGQALTPASGAAQGRGPNQEGRGCGAGGGCPERFFLLCHQQLCPSDEQPPHLCRTLGITGGHISPLSAEAQAVAEPRALLLTQMPSLLPHTAEAPAWIRFLPFGCWEILPIWLKSIPGQCTPGTCPSPPCSQRRPDGLIPSQFRVLHHPTPAQSCLSVSPPPH